MTYCGHVENGVVVLDGKLTLPEGTLVRVEPVQTTPPAPSNDNSIFRAADRAKPTGIPDLAINHDHYLYGHPRASDE